MEQADANLNTIAGTVSSFSDFTGGDAGPLDVALASFTADAGADGVTLARETVSEQDNTGFNLYRAASGAGPWTPLNAALIPAATPGSGEGQLYLARYHGAARRAVRLPAECDGPERDRDRARHDRHSVYSTETHLAAAGHALRRRSGPRTSARRVSTSPSK